MKGRIGGEESRGGGKSRVVFVHRCVLCCLKFRNTASWQHWVRYLKLERGVGKMAGGWGRKEMSCFVCSLQAVSYEGTVPNSIGEKFLRRTWAEKKKLGGEQKVERKKARLPIGTNQICALCFLKVKNF